MLQLDLQDFTPQRYRYAGKLTQVPVFYTSQVGVVLYVNKEPMTGAWKDLKTGVNSRIGASKVVGIIL